VTQPLLDIRHIAHDAHWLAHRYDPGHDAFHMRLTPRDAHRQATFLTDEYLGQTAETVVLRRADLIAAKPQAAPIHFIFHSAFCLSTLLARAFDSESMAMGLKEPVVLNDLSGWRQRGADPRMLSAVLDDSLTLLARPFSAGEATIVKPSNVTNSMAPAMLALRPEAKALLLYAPLDTFLKSIAKKGMWGRLWVRDLFVKQLKDGLVDLGFDDEHYLGLTDLQVAAVTWLSQHRLFGEIVKQFDARVVALDSETLLAQPKSAFAALATHYGLSLTHDQLEAIVSGPAFTRHSKSGDAFGAEARADEYARATDSHGEEIEKVAAWAAAVAENVRFDLKLGNTLINMP
jgi:hypothetical protein